jgi:pyrimidine operon attenuation protein / uracil phosphoribosyltransferase
MQRALQRLAHELAERHGSDGALLLAGIPTRGVPLARRLAETIARFGGTAPETCEVSTGDFRDDRGELSAVNGTAAVTRDGEPVEVNARAVVLVDDVLCTGRTVRAAIDAVLSCGRPARIEVLALVDRGRRELPVRATYVGKNVPTGDHERVQVRVREIDGIDGAWLVPEVAS